jgi:thiamine-monophosphate kinase
VWHLCEESGCGAVLRAEAVPIDPAAHSMGDNRTPLEHALGDGEDFELAFAVDPDAGRLLLNTQVADGVRITRLGEFVENGLWLEENGMRRPLPPAGYVHALD